MALLERGRLREAREVFWQEAETANANGDVEALAEAALGLGGIWVHEHRTTLDNARVEALQRQALEALPHDHALARRLRMRLAAERAYRFGHGDDVFTELEHARAVGDAIGLAEALSMTHHCLLGPQHTAERAALAEELIAVSPATGRPLDGLVGLMWRTIDLLLAGDRRACRSLTELRDGLVATPCDALAFVVAAIDVMLATRQGRLDEADRLAAACYELGCDVGDADAFGWYGAQLVAIRWLQGRGNELLDLLDRARRLDDGRRAPASLRRRPCHAGRGIRRRAASAGCTRLPADCRSRRAHSLERVGRNDARRVRGGVSPG